MSTKFRRLSFVGVLVGIAVAACASPAAASTQPGLGSCGIFGNFDSFAGSFGATARGGDVPREPELNQLHQEVPVDRRGKGGSRFSATIPVYFHVISDGAVGNVTQDDIDTQISIMNRAAQGFYGGANTRFKFVLAGVTRTDNAAWFNAGPGSPEERAMKQALSRGAPQALNYYSTTAGPYLGWAYLPGLTPSRMYLDGIVVDWESMYKTSTSYAGRFDLGFTAVHEYGHWLNLEHTFYRGCSAHGDNVDDTPAMKVPTRGCPVGKDTCLDDPGLDPIHNFMDYSDDPCYTEFSPGQAARMQDAYLFWRAS